MAYLPPAPRRPPPGHDRPCHLGGRSRCGRPTASPTASVSSCNAAPNVMLGYATERRRPRRSAPLSTSWLPAISAGSTPTRCTRSSAVGPVRQAVRAADRPRRVERRWRRRQATVAVAGDDDHVVVLAPGAAAGRAAAVRRRRRAAAGCVERRRRAAPAHRAGQGRPAPPSWHSPAARSPPAPRPAGRRRRRLGRPTSCGPCSGARTSARPTRSCHSAVTRSATSSARSDSSEVARRSAAGLAPHDGRRAGTPRRRRRRPGCRASTPRSSCGRSPSAPSSSTHMRLRYFPGGAHLLLAVVGLQLRPRFQLPIEATAERVRAGLRTAARIAVPSVVWVDVGDGARGGYSIGTLLLVNNYIGSPRASARGGGSTGSSRCSSSSSVLTTLLMAIPGGRRRRAAPAVPGPTRPARGLTGVAADGRARRLVQPALPDPRRGVVLRLGWLIQRSTGTRRNGWSPRR